jgi:hypothetical protein
MPLGGVHSWRAGLHTPGVCIIMHIYIFFSWVQSGGRFQGLVWRPVEDCYEWGGTQEHFPRLSVYREAVDPLEEAP